MAPDTDADADADASSDSEVLRASARDRQNSSRRCACCCRRPLQCLAYTVHVLDLLLGISLSIYGTFILVKCLIDGTQSIPTAAVWCSAIFGASMFLSASYPLDATSQCGRRCLSLSTCLSPLILTSEVAAFIIVLVRSREIFHYLTIHGEALGLAKNIIRWLNDHYGLISGIFLILGALELCRFIMLLQIRRRLSLHRRSHRSALDESDEELERRTPLLGWRSALDFAQVDESEDADAEVPFEERHHILKTLQDVFPGETGKSEAGGGGGIFSGSFRFWDSSRFLINDDTEDIDGKATSRSVDESDDMSVGFAPVDQDLKNVGLADSSNWWSLYEGEREEEKAMESSDEGRGLV